MNRYLNESKNKKVNCHDMASHFLRYLAVFSFGVNNINNKGEDRYYNKCLHSKDIKREKSNSLTRNEIRTLDSTQLLPKRDAPHYPEYKTMFLCNKSLQKKRSPITDMLPLILLGFHFPRHITSTPSVMGRIFTVSFVYD